MPAGEVDKEIDKAKGLVKELKEVYAAAERKASKKTEPTLAEWVRSTLAIFIVIFLLSIFGAIWILFGIEDVARAATFLLPLVTLVLGYYFGKEGKKAAQVSAEESRGDAERERLRIAKLREHASAIAAAETELKDVRKTIKVTQDLIVEKTKARPR